jgi:hypothetical protein
MSNFDDIDPTDMVDIDLQLYKEELERARELDPVGYVMGHINVRTGHVDTVMFGIGGHTHQISRQDAQRLARSIYDAIEGGEKEEVIYPDADGVYRSQKGEAQ